MAKVKKKRLKIYTETYTKVTFRKQSIKRSFCVKCDRDVNSFSKDFIFHQLGFDLKKQNELLTNNQIHLTSDKKMLCSNSVTKYLLDGDE